MAHDTKTFQFRDGAVVRRIGYGAMRLTGDGVWGAPPDPADAKALLRRVVDLGVNFIDTADSYGPDVSEQLIGEALAPYPDDLVIATKVGFERPGPGEWRRNARPEHVRSACEGSLRRLRIDRIPLYQLHRVDPEVPVEESIGAMLQLRQEGKIDRIGLSEVSVDQLRRVQRLCSVDSVQNRFGVSHPHEWARVVDACAADDIAFIPWYPLGAGDLGAVGAALDRVASAHDTTRYAVALSWLLHRSPNIVVIPGTTSIAHLEENVTAERLVNEISDDEWTELEPSRDPVGEAKRLLRRARSAGASVWGRMRR